MWNEQWDGFASGFGDAAMGTMPIPLTAWGLLAAGFVLGICFVLAPRSRTARMVPLLAMLTIPVFSAIAIQLPHSFQNGTVADAEAVNENFEALNLALESTASGVVVGGGQVACTSNSASFLSCQSSWGGYVCDSGPSCLSSQGTCPAGSTRQTVSRAYNCYNSASGFDNACYSFLCVAN